MPFFAEYCLYVCALCRASAELNRTEPSQFYAVFCRVLPIRLCTLPSELGLNLELACHYRSVPCPLRSNSVHFFAVLSFARNPPHYPPPVRYRFARVPAPSWALLLVRKNCQQTLCFADDYIVTTGMLTA